MLQARLRRLPSIDHLLKREGIQALIAAQGRTIVRDRLREVLSEMRLEIESAPTDSRPLPLDPSIIDSHIEDRLASRFGQRSRDRLQRVVNATGVVLHTNLGRARLGEIALDAIAEVAGNYSNLEYDLSTG
ncbi:MAG: L-seryl-tRNA(Sec) selenium transferase, partial [Acidobacteriota bacterium]